MVMTKQVGPNGTPLPGDTSTNSWTSWEDMGGHDLRNVTARESLDHRLELVAHGADAIVYHRYEAAPNNWTEWAPISAEKVCGPYNSSPARPDGWRLSRGVVRRAKSSTWRKSPPMEAGRRPGHSSSPTRPGAEMVPSPWRSAPTVSSAFSTIDCSAAVLQSSDRLSKHATAAMERVGEGQRRELVAAPSSPRPRRPSGRAAIARTGRRGSGAGPAPARPRHRRRRSIRRRGCSLVIEDIDDVIGLRVAADAIGSNMDIPRPPKSLQ